MPTERRQKYKTVTETLGTGIIMQAEGIYLHEFLHAFYCYPYGIRY